MRASVVAVGSGSIRVGGCVFAGLVAISGASGLASKKLRSGGVATSTAEMDVQAVPPNKAEMNMQHPIHFRHFEIAESCITDSPGSFRQVLHSRRGGACRDSYFTALC
jgi:hypothetical protein